MRLAFEEKKRDHERKLALNSALKEEERLTLGKLKNNNNKQFLLIGREITNMN